MIEFAQTIDKFALVCAGCGERYEASVAHCPKCPGALLRADYAATAFEPLARDDLFRFLPWLPFHDPVETAIGPVVYRSERLAVRLGDVARVHGDGDVSAKGLQLHRLRRGKGGASALHLGLEIDGLEARRRLTMGYAVVVLFEQTGTVVGHDSTYMWEGISR